MASCAGEIGPAAPPPPPVTAPADIVASAHQRARLITARIGRLPLRNAFFATRAVAAGTSGSPGFGCIDMTTRFCGHDGNKDRQNTATAQTIMNQAPPIPRDPRGVSTQ